METATSDVSLIIRAVRFASHKHREQRRKDAEASPYINHPIALADVLANEAGVREVEVLCAALLHDTIEDTDTSAAELEREFGARIAAIVGEVTDDKSLDKATRKRRQVEHAAHVSREAMLVKLADKICNLRDLLAAPPGDWSLARQREYFDWAAEVIANVRGAHRGLEALFDQVYARRADLG